MGAGVLVSWLSDRGSPRVLWRRAADAGGGMGAAQDCCLIRNGT